GRSMAQALLTNCLAAVTYLLPGPEIFSTRGIEFVPYARAAIACAPPTRAILSMPRTFAVANSSAFGLGQTAAIFGTPATWAGTAVMTSVDTSENRPPGM